jgi:tetratricopeptide (TPR) repeat protein
VFPFAAVDARLGVAVADRVVQAVAAPTIPPELALSLVPPYIVQEGRFLSPLALLGGTGSRHAAELLQGVLGVEVVVTGAVRAAGEGFELTLHVARAEGARSFRFTAPESAPEELVRGARAALQVTTDLPLQRAPAAIDLASPYGDFARGLVLLAQGRAPEAVELWGRAARAPGAEPRWERRRRALQAALTGDPSSPPLLRAVLALGALPLDAGAAQRAFADAERRYGTLPLGQLWQALIAVQAGGDAGFEALARGWGSYPFGAVQAALDEAVRGGALSAAARTELAMAEAPAALLGGVLLAQVLDDPALEAALATRLGRRLPTFAYAFERVAQLALAADDPLTAAQALRTATRLEPAGSQSDLYWTNLGWAYYLLGVLGESEAASTRALELNPEGTVARYNLALVQTVSGRLGEALTNYEVAAERDLATTGTVDAAAVEDLRGARRRFPHVAGIDYALATLLEASGEEEAAARALGRFIARAGPRDAPLVAAAQARRAALLAPTPPLALGSLEVGLGPQRLPVARFLAGDRVQLRVELSTPGVQLPRRVTLELVLSAPSGEVLVRERRTERLALPPQSVAVVLEDLSLTLPSGLAAGTYALRVRAHEAVAEAALEVVEGRASLTRQLVGSGVILRELSTYRPLYTAEPAPSTDPERADEQLLNRLHAELARSAAVAKALPEVTQGRFAGLVGADIFAASDRGDVRDFLQFLLLSGEAVDAPFAELYARWAVAGAPRAAPEP